MVDPVGTGLVNLTEKSGFYYVVLSDGRRLRDVTSEQLFGLATQGWDLDWAPARDGDLPS